MKNDELKMRTFYHLFLLLSEFLFLLIFRIRFRILENIRACSGRRADNKIPGIKMIYRESSFMMFLFWQENFICRPVPRMS